MSGFAMRALGRVVVAGVLASAVPGVLAGAWLTDVGAQAQPDVFGILAAAREALGGETHLSAVKSFMASGRTRQVRGDNLVPIEFEISCELPDKYIRRDEIPAQESGPTTIGFSGSFLIQLPVPSTLPARAGAPTPTPAQLEAVRNARVTLVKQDFARLTLGMFAATFSSYPLAFAYVGEAESPQGRADVIEVTVRSASLPAAQSPTSPGPARGRGSPPSLSNFTLRWFVYKDTHLPIMVSWTAPFQGKPIEQRLYYADYRDVDGMKFPFRLRRAVGADTTEETTIDRYRINPKIDPRKFEVR